MITINNPDLEKEIIWEIKSMWVSAETYIISAVRYFKEIKKDNFLSDVIDTKVNWKTFENVDDLMADLTS